MIAAILQLVAIACMALAVALLVAISPDPITWARRQWQWWQVKRAIKRSGVRYPVPDVTRRIRK